MSTEYQVMMLPINEQLETALKKIAEDGWNVVPGTFPMAIYNLQREEREQHVEVGIDDSLVTIIKGNVN